MSDPMEAIRCLVHTPADAVRWASVLEATAPKVGNVYPGKAFEDLSHHDFLMAAEIASECLADPATSFTAGILAATKRTVQAVGGNVNLGILLLIGPLVAADHRMGSADSVASWRVALSGVLDSLNGQDARHVFEAIRLSQAGGLGKVDKMDVNATAPGAVDLLEAMRSARERDRVARQ
ncbi:MAG: triphosphoribosyl-dephospho-CoA synthase, partial [Pirellulales bacterium]|nr:triphosphoribosyl-dephospho-CoA synthase [Pirellulales bacterium]